MAHIVATRPVIEGGLSGLREAHTLTVCDPPDGSTRSVDELIALTDGADVLLSILADPVTERLFEARPNLKMVAQYAVGVDNIDLEAARTHSVAVTHTPGVLTAATADLTWALLLAVARHVPAADQYVRDGRFERWETTLMLGMELAEKTIGIVGLGRIGRAVARRALGFGMDVVYHNRSRANPTHERQASAQYVSLDELLKTSDVVSLHCPHNEDSHHLIDAAALAKMKSSALLVNTARGPVVDEGALDYDDRVVEHWPAFAEAGTPKAEATVRHVLSHQGGFPLVSVDGEPDSWSDWDAIAASVEAADIAFEPGSTAAYNVPHRLV